MCRFGVSLIISGKMVAKPRSPKGRITTIYYGWWIVIACFLIGFYVAGVVFYSFTCFFEPIVADLGWSYTQVSLASSLRGLEMGLFAPIVGFLVDRHGSRKLMLSGAIIVSLGLILLSLSKSLAMFYGSFFLLALGAGGCTSVVLMVAVANWFRSNLGKALGITVSGFGAGGLFIPLTIWLINTYQWRTSLVILGLGMLLLGIPLSLVIRDKPEECGYIPDGEAVPREDTSLKLEDEGVETTLKEALANRSFWQIAIVEAIRMVTITAVIVHVMPYLSSTGMSRPNAGLVASAIPLMSLAGRFGFGWLGDLFDKRHLIATTLCLMAMGMAAFTYAEVRWVILPFLLLFPPAYGGAMTLRASIMREYFGRTTFGRTLGITMGLASIGGIIGPTLAGWTFDTFSSYHYIWLALCGLNIIAIPVILMARSSLALLK